MGFLANDTNLRRYVGNNPTNHLDPSGLEGVAFFGEDYFDKAFGVSPRGATGWHLLKVPETKISAYPVQLPQGVAGELKFYQHVGIDVSGTELRAYPPTPSSVAFRFSSANVTKVSFIQRMFFTLWVQKKMAEQAGRFEAGSIEDQYQPGKRVEYTTAFGPGQIIWYVDNVRPTEVLFYIEAGSPGFRYFGSIVMFDKVGTPEKMVLQRLSEAWGRREEMEAVVARVTFVTQLADLKTGTPYYQWQWSKSATWKRGTEFPPITKLEINEPQAVRPQ